MSYKHLKHPVREAGIAGVKLIGHNKVRIEICYSTHSKDHETYHREQFDLTFCDVKFLGHRFHQIVKELQGKLDEFKQSLLGN